MNTDPSMDPSTIHTAIVHVDIAFETGELAFSRAEFAAYENLCWRAGEDDYEPTCADYELLTSLLERLPPFPIGRN
jgi:hypothetical protein